MKHWYVLAVKGADGVAAVSSGLDALKFGAYVPLRHERHQGGFIISRLRFPGYVIGHLDMALYEHEAVYRINRFDYILPRNGPPSALPANWIADVRAHITAEFFRAKRAHIESQNPARRYRQGDTSR